MSPRAESALFLETLPSPFLRLGETLKRELFFCYRLLVILLFLFVEVSSSSVCLGKVAHFIVALPGPTIYFANHNCFIYTMKKFIYTINVLKPDIVPQIFQSNLFSIIHASCFMSSIMRKPDFCIMRKQGRRSDAHTAFFGAT